MNVAELICELLASAQSLDDPVIVSDVGKITMVSYSNNGCIYLNDYPRPFNISGRRQTKVK